MLSIASCDPWAVWNVMFERSNDKTHWEGVQLLTKSGEPIAVNVSTTWVEWNSRSYIYVIACKRKSDFIGSRRTRRGCAGPLGEKT